jgi:hypothetical protein
MNTIELEYCLIDFDVTGVEEVHSAQILVDIFGTAYDFLDTIEVCNDEEPITIYID